MQEKNKRVAQDQERKYKEDAAALLVTMGVLGFLFYGDLFSFKSGLRELLEGGIQGYEWLYFIAVSVAIVLPCSIYVFCRFREKTNS